MTSLTKMNAGSFRLLGRRENDVQNSIQRNDDCNVAKGEPDFLMSDSSAMYVAFGPLSSLTTEFDKQLRTMDSKVEKWQQQEISWAAQLRTHVKARTRSNRSIFFKKFKSTI